MAKMEDQRELRCSFCGKHQEQVSRIIAGPGAYICNECVQLCMSILDDAGTAPEEAHVDIPDVIPTPREIRDVLFSDLVSLRRMWMHITMRSDMTCRFFRNL